MKIYFLATSLFVSIALFSAEHSPYEAENYQARGVNNSNKQLLDLLEGKQPTIAGIKKAKVKHGFGATFDFVTPLRQGEGKSDGVYKKRLKYLQYYLGIALKPSTEHRWSDLQQYAFDIFRGFAHAWSLYKETAPEMIVGNTKIDSFEISNELNCQETQTPYGPLFIDEQGNVCCKIVTADAALIAYHLRKFTKSSDTNRLKKYTQFALETLKHGKLSEQAKKLLLWSLAVESFNSKFIRPFTQNDLKQQFAESNLIAKFVFLKQTISEEDKRKVEGALSNLSHYNNICTLIQSYGNGVLKAYLKESYGEFTSGMIHFNPELDQISVQIARYSSAFDTLEHEYGIINDRINQELKISPIPAHIHKKNNKHPRMLNTASDTTQPTLPEQQIDANQIHEADEAKPVAHAPITYTPRVKKWFKKRYTHYLPQSRVRYHTLLPLAYDEVVVAHGERNPWHNRTYEGQIDTSYQLPGTVTFDDGTQETYLFELCINPQGQCYHRGCKKLPLDQLLQSHPIEIDEQENALIDALPDTDQIDEQIQSTGTTEYESPYWITIKNPDFNCSISFLKSNSDVH